MLSCEQNESMINLREEKTKKMTQEIVEVTMSNDRGNERLVLLRL